VENRQALAAFEAIAAAADGVVLSRGNLGLDVAPEKTALVQKHATTACNLAGKPVMITRVVDTMVAAPRCTRCAAGARRVQLFIHGIEARLQRNMGVLAGISLARQVL
jgi:pyruvate kinase